MQLLDGNQTNTINNNIELSPQLNHKSLFDCHK